MRLRFNIIFQVCAFIVQGANFLSGMVPPKYQPAIALVTGLAQAVVAWRAHYFNPDGTSARSPYFPPGK